MPEGHTIHRIARDHSPLLVDHPIRVSSPQGPFATSAARIDGATLQRIEPFGKHLFYWWSTGEVGHVHLGLFGKFRVHLADTDGEVAAPVGAVRMRLRSPLAAVDVAGPTACEVGPSSLRDSIVDRLGPDPLRRGTKPDLAIERIVRSRQPIGALLLDQRVLCGVGNVYRAEALFVHGIRPDRAGSECTAEELAALWRTVVTMLRKGVRDNRIVTVDPKLVRLPTDRKLRRGEATYVYHRPDCLRCGSSIETLELGGRPCYYCPDCQPR